MGIHILAMLKAIEENVLYKEKVDRKDVTVSIIFQVQLFHHNARAQGDPTRGV